MTRKSTSKPRSIEQNKWLSLSKYVGNGEYSVIRDTSDLPQGHPNYIGTNFVGMFIAGSTYVSLADDPLGSYSPLGPVYLREVYRRCYHDGTHHVNVDRSVIWQDSEGSTWQVAQKDDSDHYRYLVEGTILRTIDDVCLFPNGSRGKLSDLGEHGRNLNVDGTWPRYDIKTREK